MRKTRSGKRYSAAQTPQRARKRVKLVKPVPERDEVDVIMADAKDALVKLDALTEKNEFLYFSERHFGCQTPVETRKTVFFHRPHLF